MHKAVVKKIRHHVDGITKIQTSPNLIALSFAVGTFMAILPTPGLSIILGLIILLVFPRLSKLAMLAAFVVWNPLVTAPFYLLSYKIGGLLFGSEPLVKYNIVILNQAYNFSRRFLVGNLILALSISGACYMLVRILAELARRKRNQKE